MSGTTVAKKSETEQRLDLQAIQEQPSSSFEFEKIADSSVQQDGLGSNFVASAGKAKNSTLKNATISRKAFSVQDKVVCWN